MKHFIAEEMKIHLDHGKEDSDSAKDGHNWSDVQELLCQTVCVCVCVVLLSSFSSVASGATYLLHRD